MSKDHIILKGMEENNLKNIDLELPKEKLIVFSGLSGSGKSSLVFGTLATESQRQMTRQFSQYLRRHMTLYERPKAKDMKNLSPVLVVQQKPIGNNVQSNVGSYMEVGPFIRLLFSRIGEPSMGSATDYSSKSSFGQCPDCSGNGLRIQTDINKLIDFDKSLKDYAVQFKPLSPAGWQGRWMITGGIFDPDTPIKDWPEDKKDLFIYGPKDQDYIIMPFHTKNGPHQSKWDGLLPRFERLYVDRDISQLKEVDDEDVLAMTNYQSCPTCQGTGLNPRVLASKINGCNIADYVNLELPELLDELKAIDDPLGRPIAQQAIDVIERLIDLGLSYLTLNRKVASLSGGESQRLKIGRQLGSSLNNMTFIFDEPSAGLHPTEVNQLLKMLKNLRDLHNTVIVVEHHPQIISQADLLVELGPGAGEEGGHIIFQGLPKELTEQTPTGQALKRPLTFNENPREWTSAIEIKRANRHNLKNLSLDIPQNVFVNVAGVSGSGKSSLILDELAPNYPDDTIIINQKAIGASSRSTLATYMGMMDAIRQAFAKANDQDPGLFSFNSTGACPVCKGKGELKPDVAFGDPVTIPCEACGGSRYSDEALSFSYKGKTITEILDLSVKDARHYFDNQKIQHQLRTLEDVGLAYLKLGQSTDTFSGGELQRLKLASQLQYQGKTYILDEPSVGLHPVDVDHILNLLNHLVDQGNTVITIEHNLAFLTQADWVIELGPQAGREGGKLIFQGHPKDLLEQSTPTGKFLKQWAEKE